MTSHVEAWVRERRGEEDFFDEGNRRGRSQLQKSVRLVGGYSKGKKSTNDVEKIGE